MRLLFISHDYTRTGAPIVLLRLIKKLKANLEEQIDVAVGFIYSRGDIKIRAEYEAIADELVNLNQNPKKFFTKKRDRDYDVLLFNTIVSGEIIEKIVNRFTSKKVLTWIHEMDFTIEHYGWDLAENVAKWSDEVLCVNSFIQKTFDRMGANCKHFSEIADVGQSIEFLNKKNKEKFELVISGLPSWRKGIYDIPEVIKHSNDIVSSVKWYGAGEDHRNMSQIRYQLGLMGLKKIFKPMGMVDNFVEKLKSADMFLMISHEDPFPLVCLEAASVKVPTICWDRGTGIVDFVKDDAGWILPYREFSKLRELLAYLKANPEEIKIRGEVAYQRVMESYSSEVRAKQFMTLISDL
jgi:glycosyltransferase involved in cell wall biosynthesis